MPALIATPLIRSLVVLLSLAALPATAQEMPSAKLILDWAIQGHNSAITMGEEKGWFKEAGANVTVARGYGSGDTVNMMPSIAVPLSISVRMTETSNTHSVGPSSGSTIARA